MKKFVSYIVWICCLLGTQSCTQEDLGDCFYGLRLHATYPFEIDNEAAPDVQCMRAYVFDENELLCAISEEKGACLSPNRTMDIKIKPGKYKIVVWGSNNADLMRTYSEGANVSGPSSSNYTGGIAIGKTTLSDLRLFLKGEKKNETEFIPYTTNYDDLYYGLVGKRSKGSSEYVEKEVVVPEYQVVEETVELIRNTNLLKVTLTGLQYIVSNTKDTEVYVSGKGQCYNWKNAFTETNDQVKFSSYESILNGNESLSMNIKLQRIRMDLATKKQLLFCIYDKGTGKVAYSLDLVEKLLKARNAESEYIYNNQEDFDRLYIHTLEIQFSIDLTVKVFVNGWEIKNIYPVIP